MSTFFGGEQLQNIATINTSSAGVAYTVPAGNYAKVFIQSYTGVNDTLTCSNGAVIQLGAGITRVEANILNFGGSASANINQSLILNSGDTITLSGTSRTLRAEIFEYKKP